MKNFTKYFAILSIFCVFALTSCMDLFDEHETSITGTITFIGNGGSTADGRTSYTQTFDKGNDFNLQGFSFKNPPSPGKSFVGWSKLSSATTYDYTDAQRMSSFYDITLYAVWVEVSTGLYVCGDGSGTAAGPGDENHPFDTIEHAILAIYKTDDAELLDWTIYIDGTVFGTNNINNSLKAKSLTITEKEGTAGTLDGNMSGPVVKIDLQGASTKIIFKNITITNGGNTENGGGVYIANSNVVFDEGVAIYDNYADKLGGGVYIESGTLTMNDGIIGKSGSENSANHGGGIYNLNGILNILGGRIEYNKVIGTGARGGGIYNAKTAILSASVSNNASAFLGGGIFNKGTLTLKSGYSITANSTSNSGGGIYKTGAGSISGDTTAVTGNTPDQIYEDND